ncbi:MAG: hypothetical protein H7A40_05185 [Chlamydiales bacterium]|nr:hypothetical protein [Chlamydiales bacterium]
MGLGLSHAIYTVDKAGRNRAKNWIFMGSEGSGEAAAVLLTLAQTPQSHGVNSESYLEKVMNLLMGHNSQKIHKLLQN